MSFVDLEAGTLAQVAAHAVFKINTKVAALRHLGEALGTPKDTRSLRGRLRVARAEAMRLAKITAQKLKQATDDGGDGATETTAPAAGSRSKLAMDFEAALRGLQQVLHRIVAAERHIVSAAAAGGGGTSDERTQRHLLGTEEHEAVVVNESELGILEAELAIAEIDDIFRNLAALFGNDDQGGSADHVVCDIEKIAAAETTTTTQRAEEKVSAMVETPASRSSSRCLLTFVLGLLLFIFVLMLV